MKINIKKWHAVASWHWVTDDDALCGICRDTYDSCCNKCRYPGDDCPPVWGKCKHAFHMHCIIKWLEKSNDSAQPRCPLCRAPWDILNEESVCRVTGQ